MALNYAAVADVQARVPYVTISGTSKPSDSNVSEWLEQAEDMIDAVLVSIGISAPITDTRGVNRLQALSTDFAEGMLRRALAAAGGDHGNDDGKDLVASFYATLEAFTQHPARTSALLLSASVGDSARGVRGPPMGGNFAVDSGSAQARADIAPKFGRDEKF